MTASFKLDIYLNNTSGKVHAVSSQLKLTTKSSFSWDDKKTILKFIQEA